MNVKNDEAQKLDHTLTHVAGESLTAAITEGVSEQLERMQSTQVAGFAERLLRIGKDCAAHLDEPFRAAGHADILYDDRGMPRN